MTLAALTYLIFTVALGVAFAGIVRHYYSPKRRDAVEAPKHRMLRDDDGPRETGRRT